jgi:hypothetical protein
MDIIYKNSQIVPDNLLTFFSWYNSLVRCIYRRNEKIFGGSMSLRNVHTWIIQHDDKWLFVILYVSLAVVLSIWISLFWLVFVVGIHIVFESIRQVHLQKKPGRVITEVLWEVKLDLALVIFALALSIYMEMVVEAVSLGLAARLAALSRTSRVASLLQGGLRGGVRFAGWQQAFRGVLLSVDDLAQIARAFGRRKSGESDLTETVPEAAAVVEPITLENLSTSKWGSWGETWGKGDWISVGMAVIFLVLILASPWLTDHTAGSALAVLAEELHPFP